MSALVPHLSLAEERACMREIKNTAIGPDELLKNGMLAGKFAFEYLMAFKKKKRELYLARKRKKSLAL